MSTYDAIRNAARAFEREFVRSDPALPAPATLATLAQELTALIGSLPGGPPAGTQQAGPAALRNSPRSVTAQAKLPRTPPILPPLLQRTSPPSMPPPPMLQRNRPSRLAPSAQPRPLPRNDGGNGRDFRPGADEIEQRQLVAFVQRTGVVDRVFGILPVSGSLFSVHGNPPRWWRRTPVSVDGQIA